MPTPPTVNRRPFYIIFGKRFDVLYLHRLKYEKLIRACDEHARDEVKLVFESERNCFRLGME